MIIEELKILEHSKEIRVGFERDFYIENSGSHVIYGSPDDLPMIEHCLENLLYLKKDFLESVESASVRFEDDYGEKWEVHYLKTEPTPLKVLKNNRQLDDLSYINLIFQNSLSRGAQVCKRKLKVSTDKVELLDQSNRNLAELMQRRFLEDQLGSVKKELEQFFNRDLSWDEILPLFHLETELKNCFFSFRELLLHRRRLTAEHSNLVEWMQSDEQTVHQDVKTLEEVKRIIEIFADPMRNPRILSEKLAKCSARLKEVETKLHPVTNPFNKDYPFENLFDLLAKKTFYAYLAKASTGSGRVVADKLSKVSDSLIQSMESLFVNDSHLMHSLQEMLGELTELKGELEEQESRTSKVIRKIVQPTFALGDYTRDPVKLETLKGIVEKKINQIADLKQNFEVIKNHFYKIQDEFYEIADNAKQPSATLSQRWQSLAAELKIDPQTTISQLANQMCLGLEKEILTHKVQVYESLISEQKENLSKLKYQVLEWEKKHKTQKSVDLSNPSILFSEAQSILRHLPQKEKQLLALRKTKAHREILKSTLESIDEEIVEKKRIWNELTKESPLDTVSIDAKDLDKILAKLSILYFVDKNSFLTRIDNKDLLDNLCFVQLEKVDLKDSLAMQTLVEFVTQHLGTNLIYFASQLVTMDDCHKGKSFIKERSPAAAPDSPEKVEAPVKKLISQKELIEIFKSRS